MRREHGQRGMITVFVTLMMVPVVVITGIMVDFARIKLYSSQAVMAADAYGEAILSEYDNLLKELYGLFSVTQNEEGLRAVAAMADYGKNAFSPNRDGRGLSGFMPYEKADVELVYENVEGASLSNGNVLMTQISDFMRFRIVEEVLGDDGVLETLDQFDSMNADMDTMDKRNALTDSSQKVLEEIGEYYEILKKINDYPGFVETEEDRFRSYSAKLREISTGSDYADYVYYLQNKEACEAALAKKDRIAADPDSGEELSEEEEEMAELTVRVRNYDETIHEMLEPLQESAWNFTDTGKATDYDAAPGQITELGYKAQTITSLLTELKNKVSELNATLPSCTTEVRDGIKEEIRELEDILEVSEDFWETYEVIEFVHQDSQKSRDNKEKMTDELTDLDNVFSNLETGNIQPGDSYWKSEITLDWYDFQEDKGEFYRFLQSLCEGGGSGGDEDAGEKKQNEAKEAQEKAEKEIEAESASGDLRNISDSLASQLESSGASGGTVPGISSYFSGGLSFEAVGGAGTAILNKFLVTSYDFGMFSSRVSGVRPEDEDGKTQGGQAQDGTYYDESLTGYRISENINYLYGAELEYLLAGHNSSQDNLNTSRNIICGVRLTMNFVSTYTIEEINSAIRAIADAAAAAVAASGVGAPAAPLVRVAVSGALRAAISTMETAADWKALMDREKTVFLKTKLGQLESLDAIAGLLEGEVSGNAGKTDDGLQLGYEDYLYVLLCLMLDQNTLMNRTANLITLNVNQAQNTGDELTTLDFKMADTVTAVKSTCKVRMDFAVTPENFIEMYLSGTSAESMIEVLEDRYFGYSIIRGY